MEYIPEWEGVCEGYAKNQSFKNLWKFISIGYEYEDLLSTSYLVFLECKNKNKNLYPTLDENQKRFMAYYKMSLHNRFVDLAYSASEKKTYVLDVDISDYQYKLECPGRKEVVDIIKNAPKEVGQVLSILINSPLEMMQSLGFYKKNAKGVFNNLKLCKMLDYSDKVDLVGMVRNYLKFG